MININVDSFLDGARIRRHNLQYHATIFSHTTIKERLALFQVARGLPSNARVLEIGSYLGSSALFISAGLAHVGGHLICVDTWNNETMEDGARDTYAEFLANTQRYRSMITPVRKMSGDLTEADISGPLDFVFIDGDHSEAAVRGDFELVSKWMAKNSILAFHDVSGAFPGVNVVVGEALASGKWQLMRYTDVLGFVRRVN